MRRTDRTRVRHRRIPRRSGRRPPISPPAFNAKNLDQILDAVCRQLGVHAAERPLLRGREPLKSFYTDLVSKVSDIRLEPADVAGHGPLAYESGTYSMNTGATRDRGKFLFVLRNMGGNWRIRVHQLEQRPSAPGGELGNSFQLSFSSQLISTRGPCRPRESVRRAMADTFGTSAPWHLGTLAPPEGGLRRPWHPGTFNLPLRDWPAPARPAALTRVPRPRSPASSDSPTAPASLPRPTSSQ